MKKFIAKGMATFLIALVVMMIIPIFHAEDNNCNVEVHFTHTRIKTEMIGNGVIEITNLTSKPVYRFYLRLSYEGGYEQITETIMLDGLESIRVDLKEYVAEEFLSECQIEAYGSSEIMPIWAWIVLLILLILLIGMLWFS